jgi:hypothetical protein
MERGMKIQKRLINIQCVYEMSLQEKESIEKFFHEQSSITFKGIPGNYTIKKYSITDIINMKFTISIDAAESQAAFGASEALPLE